MEMVSGNETTKGESKIVDILRSINEQRKSTFEIENNNSSSSTKVKASQSRRPKNKLLDWLCSKYDTYTVTSLPAFQRLYQVNWRNLVQNKDFPAGLSVEEQLRMWHRFSVLHRKLHLDLQSLKVKKHAHMKSLSLQKKDQHDQTKYFLSSPFTKRIAELLDKELDICLSEKKDLLNVILKFLELFVINGATLLPQTEQKLLENRLFVNETKSIRKRRVRVLVLNEKVKERRRKEKHGVLPTTFTKKKKVLEMNQRMNDEIKYEIIPPSLPKVEEEKEIIKEKSEKPKKIKVFKNVKTDREGKELYVNLETFLELMEKYSPENNEKILRKIIQEELQKEREMRKVESIPEAREEKTKSVHDVLRTSQKFVDLGQQTRTPSEESCNFDPDVEDKKKPLALLAEIKDGKAKLKKKLVW